MRSRDRRTIRLCGGAHAKADKFRQASPLSLFQLKTRLQSSRNVPAMRAHCPLLPNCRTLPAPPLEFEFTENVMINDDKIALVQINDPRRLGVSLCLDDFDSGFSPLSYMRHLEFSTLKIDSTFMRGLANDGRGRLLAESIGATGKRHGLALVADGVKDEFRPAQHQREQGFVRVTGPA